MSVDVRAATLADEEALVALLCARNGDDCGTPVRELLRRPGVGPGRFAVAVDVEAGRIVSSLCLIPERFRIGGVDLTVGQVEYVATAESHERRGLVRSLIDLAHRWSRDDGHLAEVIAGIPYFYRRFGYEYAVPFPRVWLLPERPAPEGWSVRRAEVGDAPAIVALQADAVDGVALACVGGDLAWWERRVSSDLEPRWFVAERDGVEGIGAVASIGHGPPGVGDVALLGAAAFEDVDGLHALAAEAARTGRQPAVSERPKVDAALAATAELHPRQYSLYVRVGDPVALLERLRPALGARLGSSAFASSSGELLVTFYEGSVLVTYAAGEVTSVEGRPGVQDATAHGGIGVPPDLVATLLFGKHGAAGLAERHEDVVLGAQAELAEVLFPRLGRDITLL